MKNYSYTISGKKVIITINKRLCETPEELIESDLFIDCLLLFKSFNTLFLNNKYYLN